MDSMSHITRGKLIELGFCFMFGWHEVEIFLWEKYRIYVSHTSIELGKGWFTMMGICTDRDKREKFMQDMGWEDIVKDNRWTRKDGFVHSDSAIESKVKTLEKTIEVLYSHKLISDSQKN